MPLTKNDFKNKKIVLKTNESIPEEGPIKVVHCKGICRTIIAVCKGERLPEERIAEADFVIYPAGSPCVSRDFEETYIENVCYISDVMFALIFDKWDFIQDRHQDTVICFLREKPSFLVNDRKNNRILTDSAKKITRYLLEISEYTHSGNQVLERALAEDDVQLIQGIFEIRPLTINNIDATIKRCQQAENISAYLQQEKARLCAELAKINSTTSDDKSLEDWKMLFKLVQRDGKIVLKGYIGNADTIQIPAKIDGKPIEISDSAFNTKNGKMLKSITIDPTVKLSEKALVRNKALADRYGFLIVNKTLYGCWSELRRIRIPDDVEHIHYGVFSSLYFCGPISNFNYYKNRAVESVILPKNLKTIGEKAFEGCGIQRMDIPDSVTEIGKECFFLSSLRSVKLPRKLQEIGDATFLRCGLESIDLPDSLKKIGSRAFSDCNFLKSIHIPSSVSEIGACAFEDCRSLAKITVDKDNLYFRSEKNALIRKSDNAVIAVANAEQPDIVIPVGVKRIESGAICNKENLKSIILPEDLQEVEVHTFNGCSELTSVIIPKTVKKLEPWVFGCCDHLESVYIPETVSEISALAFRQSNNVIIIAPRGSYAIEFAKKNGIAYRER